MTSIEGHRSKVGHGPVFLTGLAGSGKTELRRVLDQVPGLAMSRKAAAWARLRRRAHVERAMDLSTTGSERWGIQRKGLERWAGVLLAREPHARIVHLVRDPAASTVSPRPGGRGRALAQWASSTSIGVELAARRPDAYRLVRIEDVAADPNAPDLARFLSMDELPRVDDVDWTAFTRPRADADVLVEHVRGLHPHLGYASPPPVGRPRRSRFADLVAYATFRTAGRVRAWLVRP